MTARPSMTELARALGGRLEPVLIPWDCADGFFEDYWRRPGMYPDESVRRGVPVWARLGPEVEQRAVRSLGADLASGRWTESPEPGPRKGIVNYRLTIWPSSIYG
ncbi:MAG TPA: hypothetical protein VGI00_05590 [Streptosporangiaceae bacterium]